MKSQSYTLTYIRLIKCIIFIVLLIYFLANNSKMHKNKFTDFLSILLAFEKFKIFLRNLIRY